MTRLFFALAVLAAAAPSAGCIKAPDIVMVDRATALEQQASGSYDEVELKLDRAAIEPRPVALTPAQLEALGIRPMPMTEETALTDADRVDHLLVQHCVGEGKDGLLVETHEACRGAADRVEATTLIERVNRARMDLWRWMHERRKEASVEDMSRAWRQAHAGGIVCAGWVQGEDGQWHDKAC
jgi:hypothetical protein